MDHTHAHTKASGFRYFQTFFRVAPEEEVPPLELYHPPTVPLDGNEWNSNVSRDVAAPKR
jgi:hypothetical protein